VGGVPDISDEVKHRYFSEEMLRALNSSMVYASIAAIDCWRDAGFVVPEPGSDEVDWDTGAIIGTGIGGVDTVGDWVVPRVNEGKVRRLGSATVEQTMASSVSACVGGLLALGGQVTTNSSACTTGTEAVVDAFHKVRAGRARRVIAGGAEGSSHYIWAGFDAMRVLARQSNDKPEAASRPMSASAGGFVPSSGAGVLMVESLSSALARGARIYAEILGGHVNCGGQRGGGSMTAPNPEGAQRCVHAALAIAGVGPDKIEAINGHLTATMADPLEVRTWQRALERRPEEFPWINSTKSLIGHGLGAAGGIEAVASVLQVSRGFVHGSINCEDVHPDIAPFAASIPHQTVEVSPRVLAKASFGFGDVNGCLIIGRWEQGR
jgi:3-oxoacyl-(acyl-carrier-protein) synthase